MGSIYLLIELPCIDEQHLIPSLRVPFAFVKKPEGARQRDGIEKV